MVIELKVNLDVNNEAHVKGMNDFLAVLKGSNSATVAAPAAKLNTPAPAAKVETPIAPAPEATAPVQAPAAATVTLQQIKELQTKLVGVHREAIKDKLTEYGAQNASTLPEDKFEVYMAFLQSLS